MNFEDKIILKPVSLFENVSLRKELLDRKKKIVDDFRPKEKDFVDVYDEEEINADLTEIKRLQEIWDRDDSPEEKYNKELATLLEAVVANQADSNEWLGKDCEIMPASSFDDIKNGIDVVGIFKNGEERSTLGICMDVTFASNKDILVKKLDSIKSSIKAGNMPTLKYYQDPETGEHKRLSLPKIITGSRRSSAEKLVMLWGSEDEHKNKKLAVDPMQSKIILESLYQLHYFYLYAENLATQTRSINDREAYKNIAFSYANMHNVLHDVYKAKQELIDRHFMEVADDIVYQTIAEYTGNLT